MCGIIGVINKFGQGFSNNAVAAFKDLMYMNTLRGDDSSGLVSVDMDGNVDVIKDTIPGNYFIWTKDYDQIGDKIAYKDGKLLIGHNRKATIGKINVENAHPFVVNNELILVHNGSLTSHKNLNKELESDSHSIATYLHEHFKDDMDVKDKGKVFAAINGAFALVWYDVRTNKVYFIRNYQRPLWFAENQDQIWFASEPWMIRAACDRRNIKLMESDFKELPAHTLVEYDLAEKPLKKVEAKLDFFQAAPLPSTHIGAGHTSTKSETHETHTPPNIGKGSAFNSLTKNAYKKIYKDLVGKPVNFVVEDFTEYNGKDDKDWYWYGESHDFSFKHSVVGTCTEKAATDIIDNMMCGKGMITNVDYDSQAKEAIITVIGLNPQHWSKVYKVPHEGTVTHQ